MTADSVAVTDNVIRELGEQVSLALRRKMPRWGGTAFDVARGIEMYRGHCGIAIPSSHMLLKDAAAKSPEDGGAPNTPGVYVFKKDGEPVYVGRAQATIGLRNRLQQHARGDSTSSENIRNHREELTVEFYSTGSSDAAKALEARKIEELGTHKDDGGWNKRVEEVVPSIPDAAKRTVGAIATAVASDLAVFAVGGAAMEIREAYRYPDDMPLLDRCERLVRAIWERLLVSLKDRSLREVGTEVLTALASVVTAPLRMAVSAVERIVDVLRRLWMDFVDGRLKSPADVVAAGLKAVFAVASIGVATTLESEFEALFGTVPVVGEILPALCAAVVAGVMIVVGNRAIDHIVRSLFAMFQGAEVARRRREEIEAYCAEQIPRLIAARNHLGVLVETHLADREALFACTFAELSTARDGNDVDGFLNGLQKLNQAYGKTLPWRTLREFDDFMLDDSQSLKL